MKIVACVAFLSATLWTCFAQAEKAERLSDRGRLLIAGQVSGYWQNKGRRQIAVDPSLSWFFMDRASAGAYFAYRLHDGYDESARTWELGLQSTDELPLSDALGLFFLFEVGYAHVERHLYGPFDCPNFVPTQASNNLTVVEPYPRVGEHAVHFEVSVPLTYHFNSRVGVGLGPQFAADCFVSPGFANFRVGVASWLAVSI